MKIPLGLDWEVWRIYASGRFGVSHPSQIYETWTQEQLDEAHLCLDFVEDLEG